MELKYPKKNICCFRKTELNGNKTQKNIEPEDKVLSLNAENKKRNSNNGRFFKGKCNKCVKYGHIESDCWGNSNKVNENRNENKNNRKPRFDRECDNCGKIGHR